MVFDCEVDGVLGQRVYIGVASHRSGIRLQCHRPRVRGEIVVCSVQTATLAGLMLKTL